MLRIGAVLLALVGTAVATSLATQRNSVSSANALQASGQSTGELTNEQTLAQVTDPGAHLLFKSLPVDPANQEAGGLAVVAPTYPQELHCTDMLAAPASQLRSG